MMPTDDDWEWVIPPEQGDTSGYRGADLSGTISVGNRVYELRNKAGLSTQEVEDYAGVKKADLLALEAGLLTIDSAMADQLAMVLGVSAEQILGAA